MGALLEDFPLFPLPIVLLPTEVVPLHIFEERYKVMIGNCLEEGKLAELDSYRMAASVDMGADAKQGLLELRSEQARLRLLSRLFKAAMERLDVADKIAEQARGNGKVRFS